MGVDTAIGGAATFGLCGEVPFQARLLEALPKLRIQALALTRKQSDADDLVQDLVVRALASKDSFDPTTSLAAWCYIIMRNEFISTVRRRRKVVKIENAPERTEPPTQEEASYINEILQILDLLPPSQRETLQLSARGLTLIESAAALNCSVSTVKSRMWRARHSLRFILGESDGSALASNIDQPGAPLQRARVNKSRDTKKGAAKTAAGKVLR